MNKLFFTIILIICAVVLAGCLGQTPVTPNTTNNSTSTEINTDTSRDADAPKPPDESTILEPSTENQTATEGSSLTEPTKPDASDNSSDQPVSSEAAEAQNIIVSMPAHGSSVQSPFEISGQAKLALNNVYVQIKNQDGKIVVPEQEVNIRKSEDKIYGSFKIIINYQFSATKEGVVEVYAKSPFDESPLHLVEVPVKFE